MRTVTVHVPRPACGWENVVLALEGFVRDAYEREDNDLYVVLRRVQTKVRAAGGGELEVTVLPFSFTPEGAYRLRDTLGPHRQYSFFGALGDRLRDELDEHEEAERGRELFNRLRRAAEADPRTVRERWRVAERDATEAGAARDLPD